MLDRKVRHVSLPEALREHFLWNARSIVIAGTHGKTTTTALVTLAARRRRARTRRTCSAACRATSPRASCSAAGRAVRHRGRRIRQRVLREDGQVPPVPARHRRHQQHRVRSRRHLSGPRCRAAGVPALRQLVPRKRLLLLVADSDRCARRCRSRAVPCRDLRLARQARMAGATTSAAQALRHLVRASGARGAGRGASCCRFSGLHNVRNALAADRRSPHAVGARPRTAMARAATLQRRNAGSSWSATVRGVRSTTTSRTIRPAIAETLRRRRARPIPAAVSGRSSNRARPRRAAGCFSRTSPARWACADCVVSPQVFRASLPDADRLSPEELVAELNAKGTHAEDVPKTDDIVAQVAREARDGDLVVVMSNGGFDDIHQKLLRALER